jgi:hypothetical protein
MIDARLKSAAAAAAAHVAAVGFVRVYAAARRAVNEYEQPITQLKR